MSASFLVSFFLVAGALTPIDAPSEPIVVATQAPPSVEDRLIRAAELVELAHYDEAIAIFNAVLARTPNDVLARSGRAIAYTWTNRLLEATRDLDAVARAVPDAAIVHRLRGLIAVRRSDDATALAELSRSLDEEPDNPLALRFRARLYQRIGNHAAALADADAYIAARPLDSSGHVLKADLLIDQRERSLAAEEASLLVSQFSDAESWASAARIYGDLANRERAMAAIDQAIARDPASFDYRLSRARFRRWDDFGGRRADLSTALQLDPGNNDVITNLGLLDFRERKWSDAVTRFSTVLALEPRDFGLLAYRGMARLNAGDRVGAERDFRAASATASGAGDLSRICGVYAREGLALEQALEACNRAIAVDGDESVYRSNRGLVELRLGRLDAALADYNAAVAADGRRADGYYGRALVLRSQGVQQAAEADRAQALAIDPAIAESYQEYGFADF